MAEETFGPYRLERLIGRGGMGEVYRAFDTGRGRVVALKRLPPGLATDSEFRARFTKEAALAARLNEPHIIPIHDFGEIDGRLFIDMRLVEGADLAVLLAERGPMEPARVANIISQVASALDVAHAEGLVHRDIKPANILVTPGAGVNAAYGEFVYVADFGIARTVGGSTTSLTATGATVGSLDYMAPERFMAGHGDQRVDIYALGCVLFEALTGRRPFLVEGLPALMFAHLNTPPPRPSTLAFGVSPALDAVVARAMAKHSQERYQSAGELAAAARYASGAAWGGAPSGPTPVGPPRIPMDAPTWQHTPVPARAPVPPPRRRWWLWPGIAAAVAAAIVTTLLVAGVGGSPLGQGGVGEVVVEAALTSGPDPFGDDFSDGQAGMPSVITPPGGAGQASPVVSRAGDSDGVFGGDRSCDRNAIAAFLAREPVKATAWVAALNSDPSLRWSGGSQLGTTDISRYLAELTPVVLRADTRVTNHGFRDARATPFQAVLQAGTPVLVDAYGVPRVRCRCGNPLVALKAVASNPEYRGDKWPDFSPAALTAITPAPKAVKQFALVDVATGEQVRRPVGTTGDQDIRQVPEQAAIAGTFRVSLRLVACTGITDPSQSCTDFDNQSITWLISCDGPGSCTINNGEAALTFDGSKWTASGTNPTSTSFTCYDVPLPTPFSISFGATEAVVTDGVWTGQTLSGRVEWRASSTARCSEAFLFIWEATGTRTA